MQVPKVHAPNPHPKVHLYVGFGLFVTAGVLVLVIIILLQGIMSLRVYVLFGKPRIILLILATCFVLTQLVNIIVFIYVILPGEKYFEDINFPNIYVCGNNLPSNNGWSSPAANFTILAFEAFLCGLALWYSVKQTPVSLWRTPAQGAVSLTWIVVRDNLAYFFIAFASMIVGTIKYLSLQNVRSMVGSFPTITNVNLGHAPSR